MASSATAEIASAAGNLANAGSKWAYVWMIQRIFESFMSTLLLVVIVFAALYALMYFMRRFLKTFKETMHSKKFVDSISNKIKNQIALENKLMITRVDESKQDVSLIIEKLNTKVRHFEKKLDQYRFDSINIQVHEVLNEYRIALKRFENKFALHEDSLNIIEEYIKKKRKTS